MAEVLVKIAAVVLVVLLVRHFLRSPCNLSIVVRDGAVDTSGIALTGRRGCVGEFFRHNLPEVRHARVKGHWNGRYLRLHFDASLSPGQRQRIRNYLLTIL